MCQREEQRVCAMVIQRRQNTKLQIVKVLRVLQYTRNAPNLAALGPKQRQAPQLGSGPVCVGEL